MWLFGGLSNSCCSIQQAKSPDFVISAGLSDAVSPLPAGTPSTSSPASSKLDDISLRGSDGSRQQQLGLTLKRDNGERFIPSCSTPSGSSSRRARDFEQSTLGLPMKAAPSERTLDGIATPSTRSCTARDEGTSARSCSARDGLATPSNRSNSARSINSEMIGNIVSARCVDESAMRAQLKSFVRGMVQGREMNTLSVDGELRTCTCSFDRKLRNLTIATGCEMRVIPLAKIKEILQGVEPDDIPTPLDDLCATVVLDSGECLSFRFKTVDEREDVCLCLQLIVDKHEDKR